MTDETKQIAKAMALANSRAKYCVPAHYAWQSMSGEVFVSELSEADCLKAITKAFNSFNAEQLLATSALIKRIYHNGI